MYSTILDRIPPTKKMKNNMCVLLNVI